MDLVYILFPLSSFVLSRSMARNGCFEKSVHLPHRAGFAAFALSALFLGATGYDVYALNDQQATTAFLAICWLIGNGYIICNSFCSPYSVIVYTLLLLTAAMVLYNRLHSLGKFLGRDTLIPIIIVASFLLTLAILALPALKQTKDT